MGYFVPRISGENTKNKLDVCLALAIVFTAASAAYWFMFSINSYNTFHEYEDLGGFVYDMYYHLHYPGIVGGLQYLVFGNHIAPDLLMMLPAYAVFQSPLTLVFIQALVLSITGFVLFFVARNLLKDGKLALLLATAYFLNPGIHSMLIFDFHPESLIILFYILTFYFYMKKKRGRMVISLLLLLGSMEVAPFLGVTLGLGLGLYEFLHNRDKSVRRDNVRFALIITIISLVALITYNLIAAHLTSAYASEYAGVPSSLRVISFNSNVMNTLIGVLNGSEQFAGMAYGMGGLYYIVTGLVIVFLGFGIASLLDPLTSIVLTSPWLVEVFVMGNLSFAMTANQYFSFALGSIIVATILSMKRMTEQRKMRALFSSVFASSMIVFVVILTVMSPLFVRPEFAGNLGQSFMFQVNATQEKYYSELNYVISKISPNASLMAPYFTMPRLYARKYFEIIPVGPLNNTLSIYLPWFTPQYILADFDRNASIDANTSNQYQNFIDQIRSNGGYVLYAKNGTAELYRLG